MTNIFTIPDKEKDYQSYMVYVLTIIWSVVTGVTVSAGFIYYPQVWYRWLTFLCVSLFIAIFNLSLNRFGYTRQAGWSLTIMLWLYMTIPCYSAGGIFAPGIQSQISVILTAGFLLGWRDGLAIGLLSLGTDFWLAYMETIGRLPHPSVIHTPITRWIGTMIPFGTVLALQYYATNHLRSGLVAMKREIEERKEAEEKIRQSEQLLKKVTSQIPGNTYMFEIDETGTTHTLFFNRGTDEINHSLDLSDAESASKKLSEALHEDDKLLWTKEMKQAYHSESVVSFQYRIKLNDQWRWRWFRAVPEKTKEGKTLWYGAAQDITPLVDYIASIEQIIFDISHVIRRPISTMMGLSILIIEHDLSEKEVKEISQKLHQISEEMDSFMIELNLVYHQKRQDTKLNIDVSSLIDKRSSLFK